MSAPGFTANKFGANRPSYDGTEDVAEFTAGSSRVAEIEDFARQAQTTLRDAWLLLQALTVLHHIDPSAALALLRSELFESATYRVRTALSRGVLMRLGE